MAESHILSDRPTHRVSYQHRPICADPVQKRDQPVSVCCDAIAPLPLRAPMAWQVRRVGRRVRQIAHLVEPVLVCPPGAMDKDHRRSVCWHRVPVGVIGTLARHSHIRHSDSLTSNRPGPRLPEPGWLTMRSARLGL